MKQKLAKRKDDAEGEWRQKSLRALEEADQGAKNKVRRYTELDERIDELEEDNKMLTDDLEKVLDGIKSLDEDVITKALVVVVRNIKDIRRKQNERIEKEKEETLEEAKEFQDIAGQIRELISEDYGNPEKFNERWEELEEVKANQEERMNKETLAGDMRSLIYNLEIKVEEINRRQEERLAFEAKGIQKNKDAEQDRRILERREKDDVQDAVIAELQARISKLERKLSA